MFCTCHQIVDRRYLWQTETASRRYRPYNDKERRAASLINDIILKYLYPHPPLALIVMDNEQLVPLHMGMKLMLTQNINKTIGFVNVQVVTVSAVSGNTIVSTHPSGSIINIFPVTRIINDIPTTTYPCMPGYATTISKIQGQTLQKVIIWLDTNCTPPGTAYVALSRVKRLHDLYFMTPLTRHQFTPATHTIWWFSFHTLCKPIHNAHCNTALAMTLCTVYTL